MIDWAALTPIIIALLVNVPTWIGLRNAARKAKSEVDQLEQEITDRVLIRARDEIKALQLKVAELSLALDAEIERNDRLEKELSNERHARKELETKVMIFEQEREQWMTERLNWKDGISRLITQLIDQQIIPAWRPPGTKPLGKLPR